MSNAKLLALGSAALWSEPAARRSVPHKAQWLCIHHGEGVWNAHTGNGYYGGLQMDISFQRSYGGYLLRLKGTANHWSYEQMWVAERAFGSGRGSIPGRTPPAPALI